MASSCRLRSKITLLLGNGSMNEKARDENQQHDLDKCVSFEFQASTILFYFLNSCRTCFEAELLSFVRDKTSLLTAINVFFCNRVQMAATQTFRRGARGRNLQLLCPRAGKI